MIRNKTFLKLSNRTRIDVRDRFQMDFLLPRDMVFEYFNDRVYWESENPLERILTIARNWSILPYTISLEFIGKQEESENEF